MQLFTEVPGEAHAPIVGFEGGVTPQHFWRWCTLDFDRVWSTGEVQADDLPFALLSCWLEVASVVGELFAFVLCSLEADCGFPLFLTPASLVSVVPLVDLSEVAPLSVDGPVSPDPQLFSCYLSFGEELQCNLTLAFG